MADTYEEFLRGQQAPSQGPVSVPAGSGVDEYAEFLRGGAPATAQEDEYAKFLAKGGQSSFGAELGRLAAGGVKRNLEQWRAMPSSLRAISSEMSGDMEAATAQAREAQGILQAAGESEWSLQKIHDPESFSYWLAEKLGEQGITALATLGTGGVAGLGVNAVGRSLMERGLLTAAGNRALTLAGMGLPTYSLSTAMETAGTSQEQFEVTGSTQPGLSLGAGAAKGLLELWAPMHIARSLLTPGLQMGKTLPGAAAKIALREGSTELAQEAIDVTARKYNDPNYEFFKDGFTLAPSGWGEGMWRLAEAGAAGAVVGGVYGAPFAGAERAQVRREQEGPDAPGLRRTVQEEQTQPEVARPSSTTEIEAYSIHAAPLYSSERSNIIDYLSARRLGNKAEEEQYAEELRDRGFDPRGDLILDDKGALAARETEKGAFFYETVDGKSSRQPIYDLPEARITKQEGPLAPGERQTVQLEALNRPAETSAFAVNTAETGRPVTLTLYHGTKEGASRYALKNKAVGEEPSEGLRPFETGIGGPEAVFYSTTPEIANKYTEGLGAVTNQAVFRHTLSFRNPLVVTHDVGRITNFDQGNFLKEAKAKGHDAVIFRGITDWGGKQDQVAVLDKDLIPKKGYTVVGIGPVTALRRKVMAPAAGDKLPQESRRVSGKDDALSLGPLLNDLPTQAARDRFLDLVEAHTPRYAELSREENKYRLWTDTELELEYATNKPQSERPKLIRVNQGVLQPAAITATVWDLPRWSEGKVWFLPGVSQAEKQQMAAQYQDLWARAAANRDKVFRNADSRREFELELLPTYSKLISNGLRVVPSRGAGFYYNGVVEGQETDLDSTKRSEKVAWYNPMTGYITPFKLDINGEQVDVPEQALMVSVDFNKLKKEEIAWSEDGSSFQLKDRFIDPRKLTPGIAFKQEPQELFTVPVGVQSGQDKTTVYVWDNQGNEALAKTMGEALTRLAPAVDLILKSVGLGDRKLALGVTETKNHEIKGSPAAVFVDVGAIVFSPSNFAAQRTVSGDAAQMLLTMLMHELGHYITYEYYKQLPIEVQNKLWYAYEKARLAFRMGDNSRLLHPGTVNTSMANYWSSFPEWLAEQFRRWSTTAAEPKGWLEDALAGGMKKLEQYYREVEKTWGPMLTANLAEPDYHFSAVMELLRGRGSNAQRVVQRQAVKDAPQAGFGSPTAERIAQQVELALRSLSGIVPPEVQVRINQALDPGIIPGMYLPATAEAQARWIVEGNLIEIATGALPAERVFDSSRQIIAHEAMHAYEDLGIIGPDEIRVLMRDIKGKETRLFSLSEQAALRKRVKEYGLAHGWTEVQIQQKFEQLRDKELRAYYIQQFVDTGFAYSEQGRGVLSWIVAMFERVANFIRGDGFQTREDVLRAFFRGEMVARREQEARNATASPAPGPVLYSISPEILNEPFDTEVLVGENWVRASYEFKSGEDKRSAKFVKYTWVNQAGKPIGYIELNNRMPRGFEISWIESEGFMLAPQMIQFAEQDLGFKMKVAAELTEEGYQQSKVLLRMRGRQQGVLDLYTPVRHTVVDGGQRKELTFYLSPHELKRKINLWTEALRENKTMEFNLTPQQAVKVLTVYRELLKKLPLDVWKDPRLEQMFSLKRNWERDEVQGSILRAGQAREESRMLGMVGMGEPQGDPWRNAYELNQKLSQAENARRSGLEFEMSAPSTALTLEIRKLWERATGYGSSREAERELLNTAHEADRIGKFSKYAWTLDQLAIANEKATNIGGLLDLVQHKEQMNQLQNAWVRRADETAREWRRVTSQPRRDAIVDVLFSLSEMNYLSPAERKGKVKRLPTGWAEFQNGQPPPQGSELAAEFQRAKVRRADHELIRRIHLDFATFLVDVEKVSAEVLQRKFGNSPQVLQQALTQLAADMQDYRSRPYFPMMRFGEFVTVVRERGKVVASYAYPTILQRDAALRQVRQEFPIEDIQVGRISANQAEFMSLPGPLIKLIKENLFDKTGKTPEQQALIDKQVAELEELELLHTPDRTFRKRWMPSTGVPGYSADAFRAYSHYFQYGSRYLSRMAYMDLMQNDIARLKESEKTVGNFAKRREITNYAEQWLRYILEPGRDSGKFRAVVSLWYLGFSPAAAFMNLTQNLTTTWPWLTGKFGYAAQGALVRATNAQLWRRSLTPAAFEGYQIAHEEMVRQGFIDIGQAPELAAFAEGHNLNNLMAASRTQKAWSSLSYWGMAMFGAMEAYNREIVMRAAWDLAIKNPQNPRLREIEVLYPLEIADLIARTGQLGSRALTHDEAVAFLFAKETIKRTQFVYDKTSDPPFMRGKAKDLLIFFKYTQGMLFAFGYNGAVVHMLLVMAFLYGLAGVPGAEDANEVLKLIAQKLFGKDVDLLKSAREMIRGITRGTAFDQTGPDLALHGISRFGFGLGLLPDHWGAPRFDASANGSMGRIVPGLYEFAHGAATGQKFADVFAQSAQRVSGAGYGTFYTVAQALMEAPSAESKKWEQLLQRQLKALAKAYRYGVDPQAETTRSGAKIVKFDASDPDDVATVLAQAVGFTPQKVSQTWDLIRATREEMAVWDMRRKALYVQFDRVLQETPVNAAALEDMLKAIRKYNEDVPDSALSIKAAELQQSLRQRHRARAMQEQTLGANRREAIMTDRVKDLYPGVTAEKVK